MIALLGIGLQATAGAPGLSVGIAAVVPALFVVLGFRLWNFCRVARCLLLVTLCAMGTLSACGVAFGLSPLQLGGLAAWIALVGIVLYGQGRSLFEDAPETERGKLLSVLSPAFWLAIGSFLGCVLFGAYAEHQQRIAMNQDSAVGTLKVIKTSATLFRLGDKDGNDQIDYPTDLEALVTAKLIPNQLRQGTKQRYTKQGYTFEFHRSKTHPELGFVAIASPLHVGVTGQRYYAVSQRNGVRSSLDPIAFDDRCDLSSLALVGD